MDCLISVVIPFYRTHKDLFSRCMSRIPIKENLGYEVIVIDDGSPREYYATLEEYEDYPFVRIIHTENKGVSSARNRGIQEAEGKWILFCDSDDYMDTEALRKIADNAENYTSDVVIFNGGRDGNGRIRYNTTFLKEGINYAAEKSNKISVMESALTAGLLPEGYIQSFSLGAPYCKLIRTDFLRDNEIYFDTTVKLAEDTLFSLELFNKARDIQFIDINLYYYVNNPQSVTRVYRPGLSADMDIFFERTADFLKKAGLDKELEKGYYTRVQFEIGRSFRLQFFNPKNKDPHPRKTYLEFVSKEPYRTALKKGPLAGKNPAQRLFRYLMMKKGYGNLYNNARGSAINIKSIIRRHR